MIRNFHAFKEVRTNAAACGPTETSSQPTLETIGATLKQWVGGLANGVLDDEKLAEFIEQRQSKARIGT